MELVFEQTGEVVRPGFQFIKDDEIYEVIHCPQPHKASSSGKITCKNIIESDSMAETYYTQVWGMKWVNREDQGWLPTGQIMSMVAEIRGYPVTHLSERALVNNIKSITMGELDDYPDYALPLKRWIDYKTIQGEK